MSEGLFRDEALRHHTAARTTGDVLRLPPSWTRWTFAFLVAVSVTGALYATLGSVTIYARGAGIVGADHDRVTVYLPALDRERLTAGLVLRLSDPSEPGRTTRARVDAVAAAPVPLAEALAALRLAAWPDAPAPSRLAVVEATIVATQGPPAVEGKVLTAAAPVGKRSLAGLLLPSLGGSRER